MITILNFSHALTGGQVSRLETMLGEPLREVRVPLQLDQEAPFAPQVEALVGAVSLSAAEWQTLPLLVAPPALNVIAVTVLAYLHGLMGHFPAVLRLREVADETPTRYEVAELLNLQQLRSQARQQRNNCVRLA